MTRPPEIGDPPKWSPRRTLAFVVISSLLLWAMIIGFFTLIVDFARA